MPYNTFGANRKYLVRPTIQYFVAFCFHEGVLVKNKLIS